MIKAPHQSATLTAVSPAGSVRAEQAPLALSAPNGGSHEIGKKIIST
ncbi:MAG: hypothetical protein IKR58_02210 [Lachnospiraceae bacterium]|nr:hypothetical protein [Lachnospiraceae bacterium]